MQSNMNQLFKKEIGLFFIVTGLAILTKIDLAHGMNTQQALLNDPRFTNCMTNTGGPEDPNFVSILTKCYSMAGRPRFGKRSWNNQMFKHIQSRGMDSLLNQQTSPPSQPMSFMEDTPAQIMYPLPYSRATRDFPNY